MRRTTGLLLMLLMLLAAAVPAPAEETGWKLPLDLSPGMPLRKGNYIAPYHYKDPTIEMEAQLISHYNSEYWIAEVTVKDATQIRTMPACGFDSPGTADGKRISSRAQAVLACDGDFWGRDVRWMGNYVLRQGVLYTHSLTGNTDILLIDEDGDFHIIYQATEEDVPLPRSPYGPVMYEGKQIYNALCFGPALVENNEALTIASDSRMLTDKKTGRLAICQMGKLKYAVVCCNAMSMTLQDFACLLEMLGAETAYNLDGGNSAMMFTGGSMINRNTTTREIQDIIYFASAWPGTDSGEE